MKIMVCGSIGFGGIESIREFYDWLKSQGYETINHIKSQDMDYSHIKDFRDEEELSKKIVEHDLEFVKKADVLVILVDTPSFGTAIESFVAKNDGKKTILFSPNPLPTPWPLYFSDFHVKSKEELLETLNKCV
jgi:hypothetical protein